MDKSNQGRHSKSDGGRIVDCLASRSRHAKSEEFSIGREAYVNREEIENRIWGKTIDVARAHGIISEQEAQFLVDKYLEEFRAKNGWDGRAYLAPRLF